MNCLLKNTLQAAHFKALREGDNRGVIQAARNLREHEQTCEICNPALQLWKGARIGEDISREGQ